MDEISNNSVSNKRILKNTLFLYCRMIIVLLVSLYATRVILNVLGVTDYGIYNVVAGFVSMFSFLNSAMNNTTQRYLNYERGRGDLNSLSNVFNTACQIQAIIAVVTLLLLEVFGVWYINNIMIIPQERIIAANWVFQFSSLSLVLLILQIPYSADIISHERMDYYALVSIIDVAVKLLIVIVLPCLSYDKLFVYGLLSFLLSLINFLLFYIYSNRNFVEVKLRFEFDRELFKTMLSFSGWNMLGAIAYTIQGQGLNVLVNSFFGPVVNAARAIAFQIHAAISGFSENIATAFKPQLIESYAIQDLRRTKELMFSMSKYCYLMIFIFSLPVIVEIDSILSIWLGGTVPDYTAIFAILVLVNLLVSSLNLPISQTVQATGKVKYYQIIRSLLVALTLPISWLFLKEGYNPTVVFWITIMVSIINQPVCMIILHSNFDYSYLDYIQNVILPCMLLTVVAPLAPVVIHNFIQDSIIRILVVSGVSLIWSICIAFILVLNSNERNAIIQWVRVKFTK